MLTHQGNYALAGQEQDGINGIRSMDMFTGGWVDTSKNNINQADEQMRLLSHTIEKMDTYKKPLPRFWYFPDQEKCLAILTNDGEDNTEAEFDTQFSDIESKGALMTLYIKELSKVSASKVNTWVSHGHEISGHPDDTAQATNPTWSTMDSVLNSMINNIQSTYGQTMKTVCNHWFVWCGKDSAGSQDFAAQARIEANHGIKMDMNYAHYYNGSSQGAFLGGPGNFTGTGLPMRFADHNGNIVDIFLGNTNVYDQQYMENNDPTGFYNCFKSILDRSLSNGIYSFIGVKAHRAEWSWSRTSILNMLDYANSNSVAVWTAKKALDFLQMKDAAKFKNITWSSNQLSFTLDAPTAGQGLTFMVPKTYNGLTISSITKNGAGQSYTLWNIKGRDYALVTTTAGSSYSVVATYQTGGATSTPTPTPTPTPTTAPTATPAPGEQTIFTTQVPAGSDSDLQYELGTKFKANVNGSITKVRIYTNASEGGNHSVRIWRADSTLLSGPHTWSITSGTAGWKLFTLPSALNITANTDYIVAVSNSTDKYYSYTSHGFDSPINNGNLITYTGSGLFNMTLGSMPGTAFNNCNYFRDVVFVAGGGATPTPTPTATPTPTPGATATPTPTPGSGMIGWNGVGSANDVVGPNYMNGNRWQAGFNMTVTQMKLYIAVSRPGKIKCAIYSDNSGSPGSFLKGTNELTNPATGWQTFTLTSSQSLTSGTYYWLVMWTNDAYEVKCETSGVPAGG